MAPPIVAPWLVRGTTGSATRTGLVVFAEMAPYVVMQATGGPWVERFGPRRASWLANLAAGMVLLVVPVLSVSGQLGYGALAAVVAAVVAAVGALRGLADCGSAPLVPGTAALGGTPGPMPASRKYAGSPPASPFSSETPCCVLWWS